MFKRLLVVAPLVTVSLAASLFVGGHALGLTGRQDSKTGSADAAPAGRVLQDNPGDCAGGYYGGWPDQDIAQDIISIYEQAGRIIGSPTIVRLAELYPEDAGAFGTHPYEVEIGCVPDLAIVLEGTFRWPAVGRLWEDKVESPYIMFVVDKEMGDIWFRAQDDNVDDLLQRLP